MKYLLKSVFLTAASMGLCPAEVLSFKFLDTNDTAFSTATVAGAGAYAQTNWNFLRTDWSGNADNDPVFTPGVLNSTGSASTSLLNITYGAHADPVHYDAANTWRSGAGNADANATLMNGYLDDGGDNQPYVNFSLETGVLENYTVVVYFNGDVQNGAVGRYWIESWTDPLAPGVVITDQVGISSNSYTGTFVQAGGDFIQTTTPMNVDVATGNYLVFTNMTARNFRVRSSGNGDPEDFGRGPLNAIQVLDTVGDPNGDNDSDGLTNIWESSYGLDPNSGVGDNGRDGDPDMDGLTNFEEQTLGTNPVKDDSDNDGLKDGVETGGGTWTSESDTGTNPIVADSDLDGLLDGVETKTGRFVNAMDTGSNPNVLDTDLDGLPDGWEVIALLDPNDNGISDVRNGAEGDPDLDFSDNLEEFTRGTNPNDDDSDDDTLLDGYEDLGGIFVGPTQTGTDPLNPDTDGDTLQDGVENGTGIFVSVTQTGTNPNLHDTDDDGYFDEQEIASGTDPNNPSEKPAFPVPLGFWTFDDQGATTTADLSPNGYNGVVNGGPVYVPGHTGKPGDFAVDLDGVDDSITTPLVLSNIGYFTMAGWIKFDIGQTDRSGLFGQNDILEFGFSTGDTVHLWSNPGGAIETTLAPSAEWVHIAFVGDSSGRTIFINGIEAVRGPAATPLAASAFFFNIGGGGIYDATGNFFDGQMDDVAVWNVSMSPKLIAGLANGSINPIPSLSDGLRISSFTRSSDNTLHSLRIEGTIPNVTYLVDQSTDLLGWTEVADFTGAAGTATTNTSVNVFAPVPTKLFYRIRLSN